MKAYTGWIGGYKSSYNNGSYTRVDDTYRINHGAKTLDDLAGKNKTTLDNVGILGPYQLWKEKQHYGFTECKAFENREFETIFEVTNPRATAASSEVTLIHPEFVCNMFIPDLWDILHWMTFDTTDPTNVKKFIEGRFSFVKKGSAVALVGIR